MPEFTIEQQAVENLIQCAHGFVESQAFIARNAVKQPQKALEGTQTAEPVSIEGTSNFA
jgi:hypothetical protein